MLVIFKSRVSGDVIMLERDGEEMLGILGKAPSDTKGIFTVEQLPAAISALKSAVKANHKIRRAPAGSEVELEAGSPVLIEQRAMPVLNLLERSLKGNAPVTWGV